MDGSRKTEDGNRSEPNSGTGEVVFLLHPALWPPTSERGPIAQMRLERTPDKREVGSSTLPRPTS